MSSNETNSKIGCEKVIDGAFIRAKRVLDDKFLSDPYLIKLSLITAILEGEDKNDNFCGFYTYKDFLYIADISQIELKKAINSFLFYPETHWESYGI